VIVADASGGEPGVYYPGDVETPVSNSIDVPLALIVRRYVQVEQRIRSGRGVLSVREVNGTHEVT